MIIKYSLKIDLITSKLHNILKMENWSSGTGLLAYLAFCYWYIVKKICGRPRHPGQYHRFMPEGQQWKAISLMPGQYQNFSDSSTNFHTFSTKFYFQHLLSYYALSCYSLFQLSNKNNPSSWNFHVNLLIIDPDIHQNVHFNWNMWLLPLFWLSHKINPSL